MKGIREFDSEIELIFAEAAEVIGKFPVPLNDKGLALLAKCNPKRSSAGTNYICFLLPIWLKELTASSDSLCRDLAVGNVFAMLHFFLLDDVMDERDGLNKDELRDGLVLSQLFHDCFHRTYQRHFSAESEIWTYYHQYVADWALAVTEESRRVADPYDPRQLARKSAPVKLCAAGMLLLSEQQERIGLLEEGTDLALATLQLCDDWTDWQDDLLEAENCNAFLTLVRERLALTSDEPLDEQKVRQAIYRRKCLGNLADLIHDYGERLMQIPDIPADLVAFHETMSTAIRRDAADVEETLDRLATGGGFSYLLSSNVNN